MALQIPAVFENGVFRPLREVPLRDGQTVSLALQVPEDEPETAAPSLPEWCRVYEGLTETDVREIEAIALDRSKFIRPSSGD